MYFEVEHILDGPIEAVEAAMFQPEYFAFLIARHEILTGAKPEALEDSGQQIKRRVHYVAKPHFDHVGFKKVPPQWFEFVEQSTWDKRTRKLVFDNVPTTDKVAEHFSNRGEIALEPLASDKTRRRTRAEIKLHSLPFVLRSLAPMVEQMVAREAKRLLEIEARVLNEWLASGAGLGTQPIVNA